MALPSCLDGCQSQTVLNLKKLLDIFVQLGLKIIYAKFHEDRTEYVACENVHLILTSFKMAVKFLGEK